VGDRVLHGLVHFLTDPHSTIEDWSTSKEILEVSTKDFSILTCVRTFCSVIFGHHFHCRSFSSIKSLSKEFNFAPAYIGLIRWVIHFVTNISDPIIFRTKYFCFQLLSGVT